MSYHLHKINKGVYQEVSKITEEYEEFIDSINQNNKIMALCELSDMIGAIEGYVKKEYNLKLKDLIIMKNATKRAFKTGRRI